MNADDARALVAQLNESERARLQTAGIDLPSEMQSMTIDLSVARLESAPLPINFPFRTIFVRDATDSLSNIRMKPYTMDSNQSALQLKINDGHAFPHQIPKAFLHWDAQSGKSITLYFFVTSEFRSGSQLSMNGGGVSINEGAAFTTTPIVLAPAAVTQIFTSNAYRKIGTFENETGSDIWLGTSTVSSAGANRGVRLPAGAILEWRNTAALYAYSVVGGTVIALEQI